MNNIAAVYVRLSDEDRHKKIGEESESIQNQKSMLINYCIKNNWDIYDIYCDENYSGADRTRPDFLRMLRDCEEGRVNTVVCKTLSRFSRDMEIVEKYIHGKFTEWNIRFVSIIDRADTSITENKKSRQINGLINEWYLEDLSENIRKTLYHKKIKGEYCSGYAPYGYKIDPNDKHHLVIDEPAARIVKSIFEMYKNGLGYVRIAKELNSCAVPPPAAYKILQGINYKNPNMGSIASGRWSDSAIYCILRRRVYTGTLVQGKTKNISYKNKKRINVPRSEWIEVPDMHERIISDELWNDVQKLICEHRVKNKSFKSSEDVVNPLKGKIFCGECGRGMWRMSYASGNSRYKYYRCRTVKNSDGLCGNTDSIRQDIIEEKVLEELNGNCKEYYNKESVKILKHRDNSIYKEKNLLIKNNSELKNKLMLLYDDKAKGVISEDEFAFLKSENQKIIMKNERRLEFLEKEIDGFSEKCEISKDLNFNKLSFELVSAFIDKILIYKKTDNSRMIDVKWNF